MYAASAKGAPILLGTAMPARAPLTAIVQTMKRHATGERIPILIPYRYYGTMLNWLLDIYQLA